MFLIPVGAGRYELYCEHDDDEAIDEKEMSAGFSGALTARFKAMLAAAERERLEGRPAITEEPRTWTRRLRDHAVRWVAERIAEQRLLWNLRREHQAILIHPDDLADDQPQATLRSMLQRDYDRHRRWLVVDGMAMLLLGAVFFPIPGPNLIFYYFAFRVVGHYLSVRGARQGLDRVTWRTRSSAPLTELRQLLRLEPQSRHARLRELSARLRLQHLASFYERTAVPSA